MSSVKQDRRLDKFTIFAYKARRQHPCVITVTLSNYGFYVGLHMWTTNAHRCIAKNKEHASVF